MSSLYKLSIKGIRAFEPENEETIQFGFPLTLICGQNGTGKTTVIECLKYATTGDLPPNSKGGAFVHDPSLSGRSNVSGQIKLAFRNVNGKSMITTRTVQLSKKQGRGSAAATLTFKTMEGQLTLIDSGEKISISTKNSELDAQTPIYLGASRSILDYVIFCHQDESLWPMSEASVLKKRFDDIFEASKFIKVLDNLKNIKKEMATDIKLIEQSVQHLKIDKDRAQRVQDKLVNMNESAENFTEEISELNIKIEQKEKEAELLFATNQEFQRTLSDYENLLMKKKSLQEQIERAKSAIEILSGSDEELMHQKENFSSITEEKQAKIQELQNAQVSLNGELKDKTNGYNQLIRLDGSLRGKKSEYEDNLDKISELMNTNSEPLEVQLSGETHERISVFNSAIEQRIKSLLKDEKRLLADNKAIDSEKQAQVQEILTSISREQQHQEYASADLNSNNTKLVSLKRRLASMDNDESVLETRKQELAEATKKLEEKKTSNETKELDMKIEKSNFEISKLDIELEELSKKVLLSNKQSDLRSKVNFLQEGIRTKNSAIEKLLKSAEPGYNNLVGKKIDLDLGETALNDKIAELKTVFEERQKLVGRLTGEVETNKALLDSNKKSELENSTKMNNLRDKITRVIEDDEIENYETVVEELEENYRSVMEDVNTSEVTKHFNVTAISIAEKNNHCLLCKRSFEGDSLQKFIAELKLAVDEKKIKEIQNQSIEIKKELDDVKAINLDIINLRECQKQVEAFKNTKKDLDTKESSLSEQLEKAKLEFKSIQDSLEEGVGLRKPISEIVRLNTEVNDLEMQVDELTEELNDFGTAVLSITELQALQQQKSNLMREERQRVNTYTESKYVVQREQQRLENRVKDIKLQISKLETSLSEIKNIKESITETEGTLERLQSNISESEAALSELNSTKTERIETLKQVQEVHRQAEQVIHNEVEKYQSLSSSFKHLHEAIETFEKYDSVKLEENKSKMEQVSTEIDSLNETIKENSTSINSLEKEVYEASRTEYNIVANIDYRAQISKLEETEFEINGIDIENAQNKKEEYQEKSKKLRNELTNLTSEHAGKIGEVKQIKDQIKGLQKELETEYKNVNQAYHEEWIKLQTNMLVSNDIQNYSKALDNAIMKYHSIKMEDINRILGELWSQTYKGSDISSIAIKSDVNLQAKGNRSYNYRVVMVKNASELDMRGRCSAGQKVLASILIRLALAECFGANCGMIALDEPTTNLDSENSESLAEALNHIIEYRKAQSNFQLIVITHDEKFLTHIRGDRFTDHFYRIQRDEGNKSRIYSLPIGRIQDY
ncbi:DNA repair protein RAD50 [Spathaspora sp. JA1]|nr:DNA repair protein RAD50 [Spathaspora sp. JA1]